MKNTLMIPNITTLTLTTRYSLTRTRRPRDSSDKSGRARVIDVDCVPPFDSPFMPIDLTIMLQSKKYNDRVNRVTQFTIDEFSKEADKTYKLVNIEKVVETRNRMMLLTFTAREVVADAAPETFQAMVFVPGLDNLELVEWRPKPASVATVSSQLELNIS